MRLVHTPPKPDYVWDGMTALINWVEKGKAADAIVASKVTDGQPLRRVLRAATRAPT